MVKWNGVNKKYYITKGYICTDWNEKFEVKVEDLSKGSNSYVIVSCDCIDCTTPIVKPVKWMDYNKNVKDDGKYYCQKCAMKLYGGERARLGHLKGRKTFYEWCVTNNQQDLLLKWDYDKNEYNPEDINCNSKGTDGKGYWFKCLDHPEHKSEQRNISSLVCGKQASINCNQCNKVGVTHPELLKYFVNKEDAYKYSAYSSKKVKMVCPNCGNIKTMPIGSLFIQGLGCRKCSDGVSYNEKIIFSILEQLNLEFKVELSKTTFDWCGSYRYDFYICNMNIILEAQGLQHYEQTNRKGARTLLEEQKNDKSKNELASKNGIANYITIDCRYSQLEFIKKNILSSQLAKLYDLSKIDWLKCQEYAYKSLVKTACNMWCEGIKNPVEIGKILKISETTARHYLKQGNKLNWCKYDVTEQGTRKVVCITTGVKFNNVVEGTKKYHAGDSQIINCCKGTAMSAGKLPDGTKLVWMYMKDYLELQINN